MKTSRIFSLASLLITLAVVAVGSFNINKHSAEALGCQMQSATISPSVTPEDPLHPQAPADWFTTLRPPMTVTVTTNGFVCKNKTIPAGRLRIVDAESYSGYFQTTGEVWSNPETWYITEDTFSFTLTPNDIACDTERGPDCQYILIVDPAGSNNEFRYPPTVVNGVTDQSRGWGFNCPTINNQVSCGGTTSTFALLGTPVGLATEAQIDSTNIQATIDTESPCYDATLNEGAGGYDPKCYELISDFPLLDDMNQQVRKIVFGTGNSIGGVFNALFKFIVGAAGILAVIMIIVEAWRYMTTDKVDLKSLLKGRILNIVLGLVLLLGVVVVLQTINPDLLRLEPEIASLEFNVRDRADDPGFISNTTGINVGGITLSPSDINNQTFLTYFAHNQGPAGAASILWAANKGYSEIPKQTPFMSNASIINSNMKKNVVMSEFPSVTGSSVITPKTFTIYWQKKIKALEQKNITLSSTIQTALTQASTDTGVSMATLKVMCYIESYGCTDPNAVSGGGKGSYYGLFQMGKNEFATYGKGGDIFNPYSNAYAAGMLVKANLAYLNKNWSKITEGSQTTPPPSGNSNSTSKSLLVVGDSITNDANSYANQFKQANPTWSLKKLAQDGKQSAWALQQLQTEKTTGNKYDVVSILIGTNDVYGGTSLTTTTNNIGSAVLLVKQDLLKPGGKVVLISPPADIFNVNPGAFNPANPTDAAKQAKFTSIRSYMNTVNGATYINFYDLTDDAATLFKDKIHPTTAAHTLLKNAFSSAVQ